MHYYQHHIGDYAQATAHLSMLEDAAYSRMLRWYYAEEKPLPADAAAVCRLVRATSKQERDAVEVVLSEFFELREDGHHQKRADAEIARHAQDIPDIEHKRENERERQRRARERRKQLFEELRCHGVVPDFDTPTRDLQELLSRVTSGVTGRDVTQPVTRDVTANQEPRTKNQEREVEKTVPTARPRGTRLPTGWTPSSDALDWTKAEKPGLDPMPMLERFRDYWTAQPGQKGVKTNWDATWRNWVRREILLAGGLPANGQRFVPV